MIHPSMIHDRDVYAGITPTQKLPASGWNNHSDMFRKLAADAAFIVEVGSWLGNSTIHLADAAPKARILCIDTWLGSLEMWLDHQDPERYQALNCLNGYPTIYRDFLQNMVNHGISGRVTPFPVPSSIGLRWVAQHGFRPDLLYIDASHDYIDVKMDIYGALQTGAKIICGDDYHELWPGVRQAVNEAFPSAVTNEAGFWFTKIL